MTTFYSTNDHDGVECIPTEYDTVIKRVRNAVKQIAGHKSKQILVVQTTDNKIYENIIDYSSDAGIEEQKLLAAIGKKDTVVRLVCGWSDGSFDMPSYAFRKMLCELNTNNMNGEMILSGQDCYIKKTIAETFGHQ